mmetsp:Transcript_51319/g.112474  ORF Transcript_51319/g.112474 Transcript_51319/m.112474 type:complete len:217 (+) Transcript_51319:631-1281(+)
MQATGAEADTNFVGKAAGAAGKSRRERSSGMKGLGFGKCKPRAAAAATLASAEPSPGFNALAHAASHSASIGSKAIGDLYDVSCSVHLSAKHFAWCETRTVPSVKLERILAMPSASYSYKRLLPARASEGGCDCKDCAMLAARSKGRRSSPNLNWILRRRLISSQIQYSTGNFWSMPRNANRCTPISFKCDKPLSVSWNSTFMRLKAPWSQPPSAV